ALLLAAIGTSWALSSEEEQAALAEAYGKWLNSLVEPTAITVRAERVDLTARACAIEHAASTLPHPALGRCAQRYAQFLRELSGEGDGLRRRQVLLVLHTHARARAT